MGSEKLKKTSLVRWLAIALLLAGWFLALAPHAYHQKAGLDSQPHDEHVAEGIVLVLAGLGLLVWHSRGQGNSKSTAQPPAKTAKPASRGKAKRA